MSEFHLNWNVTPSQNWEDGLNNTSILVFFVLFERKSFFADFEGFAEVDGLDKLKY